MNKEVIRSNHNHRPFNPLEIQARCPKCHSVFINDTECESCNYQLAFDLIGSPFDSKSFFSQREIFEIKAPLFYRLTDGALQQDHKSVRKYVRAMKKRFYDLGDYLFERVDNDKERRKMFLFEMEQIIPYLLTLGVYEEELFVYLENNANHPLAQKLLKALTNAVNEKPAESTLVDSVLNYKLNGMLRVGFLLQSIAMGVSMSLAGYLFLKFLATTD